MAGDFYNLSYGQGLEGFVNYANTSVEGWFVNAFLAFIWIATFYVGSKSEWNNASVSAFSFFICLITMMVFAVFTQVNEMVTFILIFGIGISVLFSIIQGR